MSRIEEVTAASVTVLVPLEVRRRNGRPRIVVPDGDEGAVDGAGKNDTVLRAIARAWDWRRRLEAGEATTLQDIATAEDVTVPFVSRQIRLAYMAPELLNSMLVYERGALSASVLDLAEGSLQPWQEQARSRCDAMSGR